MSEQTIVGLITTMIQGQTVGFGALAKLIEREFGKSDIVTEVGSSDVSALFRALRQLEAAVESCLAVVRDKVVLEELIALFAEQIDGADIPELMEMCETLSYFIQSISSEPTKWESESREKQLQSLQDLKQSLHSRRDSLNYDENGDRYKEDNPEFRSDIATEMDATTELVSKLLGQLEA
jgi:hypothetical protein